MIDKNNLYIKIIALSFLSIIFIPCFFCAYANSHEQMHNSISLLDFYHTLSPGNPENLFESVYANIDLRLFPSENALKYIAG